MLVGAAFAPVNAIVAIAAAAAATIKLRSMDVTSDLYFLTASRTQEFRRGEAADPRLIVQF